jgi:hypothetical protein
MAVRPSTSMEVSSSRGVRTPIIACRGLRAAQTGITADPTTTPVAISLAPTTGCLQRISRSIPMRPPLILASIFIMALTIRTGAQQRDTTVPRPPYLILNHEHLVILFEAEESALKALLPIGIKAAPGNVVGLNMYRTQEAVGLVP